MLQEFEADYVAGIRAVSLDAEILIEYISADPTSFNQSQKAKQLVLAQYTSGVDVICTPYAESVQGMLEVALEQQNKHLKDTARLDRNDESHRRCGRTLL